MSENYPYAMKCANCRGTGYVESPTQLERELNYALKKLLAAHDVDMADVYTVSMDAHSIVVTAARRNADGFEFDTLKILRRVRFE